MRKLSMLLLMLVFATLPALACAAEYIGQDTCSFAVLDGDVIVLKEGEMIRLNVGELLHITLAANATTGYAWECNIADETIITLVGEGYAVDPFADPDADGAGGAQHFFFAALAAGESEIVLRYKQPWMEDSEDDDLTTCMAVVE